MHCPPLITFMGVFKFRVSSTGHTGHRVFFVLHNYVQLERRDDALRQFLTPGCNRGVLQSASTVQMFIDYPPPPHPLPCVGGTATWQPSSRMWMGDRRAQ